MGKNLRKNIVILDAETGLSNRGYFNFKGTGVTESGLYEMGNVGDSTVFVRQRVFDWDVDKCVRDRTFIGDDGKWYLGTLGDSAVLIYLSVSSYAHYYFNGVEKVSWYAGYDARNWIKKNCTLVDSKKHCLESMIIDCSLGGCVVSGEYERNIILLRAIELLLSSGKLGVKTGVAYLYNDYLIDVYGKNHWYCKASDIVNGGSATWLESPVGYLSNGVVIEGIEMKRTADLVGYSERQKAAANIAFAYEGDEIGKVMDVHGRYHRVVE